MNETYLRGKLMDAYDDAMPFCETWVNNIRGNSGRPDVVLAWHGPTSWWEIKFWNEKAFKSYEQQEITCRRMARQTHVFYIVYEIWKGVKTTYIVAPDYLHDWRECYTDKHSGWDHAWLAHWASNLHMRIPNEGSRQEYRYRT